MILCFFLDANALHLFIHLSSTYLRYKHTREFCILNKIYQTKHKKHIVDFNPICLPMQQSNILQLDLESLETLSQDYHSTLLWWSLPVAASSFPLCFYIASICQWLLSLNSSYPEQFTLLRNLSRIHFLYKLSTVFFSLCGIIFSE